jgi:hypothetical protein
MFTYDYQPLTVGAAEAWRITGLSAVMQRDWRRRGHLSSQPSAKARHDVVALGTMMFLAAMAERGVSLTKAQEVVDIAGPAIAYAALHFEEAWEGEPPLSVSNAARSAVKQFSPACTIRRGAVPGRIFIWWADGTEYFAKSVDQAIGALSEAEVEAKLGGPIIVIDQGAMGKLLVRRAGKPLVRAVRIDV